MIKEGNKIKLEEMKTIQVEMLKYINQVCKENNIKYFLMAGSLIGAIRHDGFIPWDDDIDIALTHDDYKKLINILKKSNYKSYKLLDHSTQTDYFYPFAKLVDSRTIMIENNFKNIENYGVYIDIFSYHGLPNDEKEREKHYRKIKNLQRQIFYFSMINPYKGNIFKKIAKIPLVAYSKTIGIKKILEKYNKVLNTYDVSKTEYAICNFPLYAKDSEIQKSSLLKNVTYHRFENIEALILCEYDEWLRVTYGNYMELPPENERKAHENNAYWRE